MSNSNDKKKSQLGMAYGTARNKLIKTLLFNFIVHNNNNKCFHCNQLILNEKDMSVEHKIPWLDSDDPTALFFDVDNIAYSHLSCNSGAARRNTEAAALYWKNRKQKLINPKETI